MTNRLLLSLFILFTAILLIVQPLHALTDAENQVLQQQNQIIIHQEKLTQEQERRRQQRILDRQAAPIKYPTLNVVEDQPNLQKFRIDSIKLVGATIPNKKLQKQWIHPYLHKDLDLNIINKLIRDISNWYITEGYTTSRALLLPQNLASGNLTIQIIEGRIQDIVLKEKDAKTEFGLSLVFPAMKGRILNLRDLEQGLDQLNRLQSNSATMELLPGEKTGETIVVIKNQLSRVTRGQLTYDTNTIHAPGIYPNRVDLYQDNLLGLQDSIYFNFSQDNGTKGQNSNTYYLNVGIPFGYFGLTWTHSQFESWTKTEFPSGTNHYNTYTRTNGPELSWVLSRDQFTKTTLKTSLISRLQTIYNGDAFLDDLSPKTTIWKTGLYQTRNTRLGFLSLGLDFYQGLGSFGATQDDPNLTNDKGHAQFHKVGGNANWSNSIELFNHVFRVSSAISGQTTATALKSADKITIGDIYTVRSNPTQNAQGDYGAYIRNEISTDFTQIATWKFLNQVAGGTQIYLGLDGGIVEALDSSTSIKEAKIVGMVVGFRRYGPKWGWDVMYCKSITQRGVLDRGPERVYFELTCQF